jgi:predicted nicotinamide N-methyase
LEEYAIDWTMPKAAAATATATTTTTTTTIICELGCGPGLPSLTAASSLGCQVIATDIDELALDLVTAASREQNLENLVTTHLYDLVGAEWVSGWMDDVDLFVMSDVFESEAIAKGAAKLTKKVLERGSSKVWVFAQTDRAQREIYLRELQNIVRHPFPPGEGLSLHWSDFESYNPEDRLWLCGLDETTVDYG